MAPLDRVDTPSWLAEELVAAARTTPARVADFAAGGGALLAAAERRWPDAELIATDIDPGAVSFLRAAHPAWSVGELDFSSASIRTTHPLVAALRRDRGVVLLNPPFSERGAAARWKVDLGGQTFRCGRALAFACWAAGLLPPGGELLCVLPAGVVYSERDAHALAALASVGELEVRPGGERSLFDGYRLRTVTLQLLLGGTTVDIPPVNVASASALPTTLHRGQAKAATESASRFRGPIFIHTTDLRAGEVRARRRLRAADPRGRRRIEGPAVLLPRVGRPDVGKVCVWGGQDGPAVLSDCVIAILARNIAEAEAIAQALETNWGVIESCYGGTCAPYITLRRLAAVLEGLGLTEITPSVEETPSLYGSHTAGGSLVGPNLPV